MPLSNAMLLGLETNLLLKSELFYVKQYKHTPASRKRNSEFFKMQKLLENENEFFKYMRMTRKVFEYIFENTEDDLNGLLINMKTISGREKLFITIRYLVTGMAISELSTRFCIGRTTTYNIIQTTVETLCSALSRIHLRPPTRHDLAEEAGKFYQKFNFPNCVGVIGAKYILLAKIKNAASVKRKKRFSVLLSAVVDSDSRFQCVDVSEVGNDSCCYFEDVYEDCGSQRLNSSNIDLPFVLIGNVGFPLMEHIMRPYQKASTNSMKNFNERLKSATVPIDIAFEVLIQKFKILTTANSSIKNATQLTIKATCLLYNVMLDIDAENDLNFIKIKTGGDELKHQNQMNKKKSSQNSRPTVGAVEIRSQFKHYFATNLP